MKTRGRVVDWLALAIHTWQYEHSMLHLAVRLLDHVLQKRQVEESNMCAVAVTCLMLASKLYEDECELSIPCCMSAVKDTTREEFAALEMELVVNVFGGDMNMPTLSMVLEYIIEEFKLNEDVAGFARFIGDLLLVNYAASIGSFLPIAVSITAWSAYSFGATREEVRAMMDAAGCTTSQVRSVVSRIEGWFRAYSEQPPGDYFDGEYIHCLHWCSHHRLYQECTCPTRPSAKFVPRTGFRQWIGGGTAHPRTFELNAVNNALWANLSTPAAAAATATSS